MASTPTFNRRTLIATPRVPVTSLFAPSLSVIEASTQAATEALRASTEGSVAKSMSGGSTTNVDGVETRDEFGSFNSHIRIFTQMRPPCPPGGALDYIDLPAIRTAQANLSSLAGMVLPVSAEDRRKYVALVWENIKLLKAAMNINDRFLFPTVVRGESPTWGDSQDYTTSATTTLWTLTGDGRWDATEAQQRRKPGMPEPYSRGDLATGGYRGRLPQAAFDSYAALRREFLDQVAAEMPEKVAASLTRAYQTWTEERASRPCIPPLQAWCASVTEGYLQAHPDAGISWGKDFPWALANGASADTIWASNGLYTVFTGADASGSINPLFYNIPLQLRLFQSLASIFARLNVATTIADAVGFYTFNHNVFFADILGKSADQVRADQQAAMQLRLASNEVNAAITGTTAVVLTVAVGPIVSGIYLLLNQAGNFFLGWLIGGALQPTMPYPLFLRVPPEGCPILPPEPGPGQGTCTPPCTSGSTCVSGTCRSTATKKSSIAGPIVVGASLLFLLSLLRGR